MDNGYEQEPIGQGRVRFTVRPAPIPRSRFVPIALGGLAGMVVVVGSGGSAAAPLALRILLAVLAGGWTAAQARRALEARLHRVRLPGGTFVASPSGIDRAGSVLARAELGSLSVRNPVLDRRPRGARLPGTAANVAMVAASYALCIGQRERSTVIAGGMTEAIALGLLADVRRVLGADRRASRTVDPEVSLQEVGAGAGRDHAP